MMWARGSGSQDRGQRGAVRRWHPRPLLQAAPLLALCAALLLAFGALAAAAPAARAASAGGDALAASAAAGGPRLARLSTAVAARTQVLTLTGRGFGERRGTSAVSFGSRRARTYVSWSDTRIVCRVPTRAMIGALRVRVVTAQGVSEARLLRVRRALRIGTPRPLRPEGTIESTRPQLRWRAAANAGSYEVRVTAAGVVQSESSLATRSWRPQERLPYGTTVTWKVRARRAGRVGPWSRVVTVDIVAPQAIDPGIAWLDSKLAGSSYDGGTIAYFYQPEDDLFYVPGEARGLMVAPADQGILPWGGWGLPGYLDTGAWDPWNGLQDSLAVYRWLTVSGRWSGDYAALAALSCTAGGHHDWYLPAVYELTTHWSPGYMLPGLRRNGLYWSSTLACVGISGPRAYCVGLNGPLTIPTGFSDDTCVRHDVRAVRQFTYVPSVGREYGGGVVGYVLQPSDPGYAAGETHGLVVAASVASLTETGPWMPGRRGVATGVTATAVGAGPANTAAIVAKLGEPGHLSPYAAYVAHTSADEGFSDWYLPSKDELAKLYENRAAIEDLENGWYWTSSEYDSDTAWAQLFGNGERRARSKALEGDVLLVRSF